jgi:protein-S-isoprenylcysteine O-methyltransferase Ste14
MISGVLLNLLGEAILFRSTALAVWLAVFFVSNNLYFSLSEEPALERRFGEEYRRYRAAVPRWIPRLRPWQPPADPDAPDLAPGPR